MYNRKVLQITLFSLLIMASAKGSATIIDFDGLTFNDFVGPANEDGFTYSLFSGALWGNTGGGNPGGNMQGRNGQGGGVLTIGRTDGGLFTFDAADVAQFNANTNASISFEGLSGGGTLGVDSFLASTSVGTWTSHNSVSMNGIFIDELRITLDATPTLSFQWWEGVDNLVLSPSGVPEPSTLTLLALGLAVVGLRRKR